MTIRPNWAGGDAAAALDADLDAFAADAAAGDASGVDEQRLGDLLQRAEVLTRAAAAAAASQVSAIHFAILAAKRTPGVYIPADTRLSGREVIVFAERAAVFDLAMRLAMSENTVRAHFHMADTLIRRLPRVWRHFRDGLIPLVNARTAAQTAYTLPADPATDRLLDEALADAARTLTPAKFSTKARVTRERIHPTDPAVRHEQARDNRRVFTERADDGMGWLYLYSDAATIEATGKRLRVNAAQLRGRDGETRTLTQIEADIAGDLLTGKGTPYTVKVRLGVTIPVTAFTTQPELLQAAHTDPAILDGYGPIDPATATTLAASATSFRRIFTDPINGIILTMDRTTYRPTTAQREFLNLKFRTCSAPGCNRPADECDIDHTTDWQYNGLTNDDNLGPMHQGHHTIKHATKITATRNRHGGITWTTPTGYSKDTDPPPF
jgi:hypothetical protein